MARENQMAYRGEVVRCHACAAKDDADEAYRKKDGARTAGLMSRLKHGPHGPI